MTTTDPAVLSQTMLNILAVDRELSEFLDDLVRISAEHLSGEREVLCGITQRREKRNAVVASSSVAALTMDEIQAGFDEGPCLEAQRTNTVIRVSDVRFEKRWPDYMTAVRDSGLRSILAIPLTVEEPVRAAMNLYSEEVAAFDADDVVSARRHAGLISEALSIALRIARHSDVADDRRAAMESRTTIDIAVGMIMGQNGCAQEVAFGILQRASSQRNVKLRVLAEELVSSAGRSVPKTAFEA